MIYELDTEDKHRTLNLTSGRVIPTSMKIETRTSRVMPVWLAGRVVHHGSRIAVFRRSDYSDEDYVGMVGEAQPLITLDRRGPWGQESVMSLIESALTYVSTEVFPRFEPFFL